MKRYLSILTAGLLAISPLESLATDFIEGRVKGCNLTQKPVNANYYTFVVETTNEFKTFYCYGDKEAATLSAMIDKGDRVKVELIKDDPITCVNQSLEDKEYRIRARQVVEINGKKLR